MIEKDKFEISLDKEIFSVDFFTKGQLGPIYKVVTADKNYLLKTSKSSTQFQTEANILKDINKYKIPVPKVFDVCDTHPLSNDFYEVKVPLYQIYPILVQVALYGSHHIEPLENNLKRLKI